MKTNMTYHARKDRMDRIEFILDNVGLGEVVAETASKDSRGGTIRLTSTGVIIVVSADNRTIVTTYIASVSQAIRVYSAAHYTTKLPNALYKKVAANAKIIDKQP